MEVAMLVLILLGVCVFLLTLVGSTTDRIEREQKLAALGRPKCPPHRWSYHPVTERLTCIVCDFIAGSDDEQKN